MGERRKFDKAFKEQEVLRIVNKEMAVELGVHHTTVRDWVKAYKQGGSNAFPCSGNLKSEDEELRRLRRQFIYI